VTGIKTSNFKFQALHPKDISESNVNNLAVIEFKHQQASTTNYDLESSILWNITGVNQ
jgi:hypothetical protein